MKLETREEKVVTVLAHVVMILFSALAVIPFWLLIAASFSSETYATQDGYKFFPQELSLSAYEYLFARGDQIGMAYLITIIVTVIGTGVGLLAISLLAYGLVGLICWRLVRDAPSVKSLFNTGVMIYLVGLGVLLLLGLISDSQTSRAWTTDASAILYEKYWKHHGGV